MPQTFKTRIEATEQMAKLKFSFSWRINKIIINYNRFFSVSLSVSLVRIVYKLSKSKPHSREPQPNFGNLFKFCVVYWTVLLLLLCVKCNKFEFWAKYGPFYIFMRYTINIYFHLLCGSGEFMATGEMRLNMNLVV